MTETMKNSGSSTGGSDANGDGQQEEENNIASPSSEIALNQQFWAGGSRDMSIQTSKFEQSGVASDGTRRIIIAARKETALIPYTRDFPLVSDFDFILSRQVIPPDHLLPQ